MPVNRTSIRGDISIFIFVNQSCNSFFYLIYNNLISLIIEPSCELLPFKCFAFYNYYVVTSLMQSLAKLPPNVMAQSDQ